MNDIANENYKNDTFKLLHRMKGDRQFAERELDKDPEITKEQMKILYTLHGVADKLEDIVLDCMDLDTAIGPEILGVAVAMIVGITDGTGIKAVEKLIATYHLTNNSSVH